MGKGKLRNKLCRCGSKKKYKYCCWNKDHGYLTKKEKKLLTQAFGVTAEMGKE